MSRTRSIRFKPHPADVAQICFAPQVADFSEEQSALILNESIEGCALVTVSERAIKKGDRLVVKVGRLDPIACEVRWVLQSEATIYKVGLRYLIS